MTRTLSLSLVPLVALSLFAAGCGPEPTSTKAPNIEGEGLVESGGSPGEFNVTSGEVEVFEINSSELDIPTPPPTTSNTTDASTTDVPATVPAPQPCRGFTIVGPTFGPDSTSLTEHGKAILDAIATEIKERPCGDDTTQTCTTRPTVWVLGHSDERPTPYPGGNTGLSEDRATQSANYLTQTHQITVDYIIGYGSTRPAVAPNPDTRTDAERYADDRRVEVLVGCGT